MPYVESPSAQVRRLVLQIIRNSQNQYLGLAVVGGWKRDLNNLDEENFLGSLILCKYGSLLTIEDLCQRARHAGVEAGAENSADFTI